MTKAEQPTPSRAVTRADVARYAGVSTAVVSYVVNNGPRKVAPPTAARVREAIDLLNYRPNVNAQALRRGRTEMIGMVLSDPTNPYFIEFASAISAEAFAHGHALITATAQSSRDKETLLIDDLVRRQVDGLIVASVYARPDRSVTRHSRGAPIVWIDSPGVVPGYASLGPDGRMGAKIAAEHLIEVHGHTSIGLIVGGLDSASADPREQGWLQALRAAGLDDGPIARVEWSREGGYAGGQRVLASKNPPTAIFASSDLQAVGLLRAIHERGMRVPEDVAVIAFDGTKESEFCWPPLTVIAQPISEMAQAAVDLVLDPDRPTTYQQFLGELITRRSCGCTPAGGAQV